MRHLLILTLMILGGHAAFSQKSVKNDPSYSMHNYKHPNKAAYAKKHNLDDANEIKLSKVKRNDDYKHGFNKPASSEKPVIKTKTEKDRSRKSYKHPYGL